VSTRSKGSLELVGEYFEVRTQVDHGWTTSRVDRRLGLIKNLGRQSSFFPSAPHRCDDREFMRATPNGPCWPSSCVICGWKVVCPCCGGRLLSICIGIFLQKGERFGVVRDLILRLKNERHRDAI
jgi:hypothetical protein